MSKTRIAQNESSVTERLGVLSESSRLRLLRLLEIEELGVGELATITQMPQSTVSRHLKVLFAGGWIARRSEGTAGRYWLDRNIMPVEAARLWELVREQLGDTSQSRQDEHRLRGVLTKRKTDTASFFGRVGHEWSSVRRELFGDFFADNALLSLIPSDWAIADIGCGTGEAAHRLATIVRQIHAVDSSKSMLTAARKRLKGYRNVKFHLGQIENIPLPKASVDAACASLILHHVKEVETAISELTRIVASPSGRVLIIDMVEHDRKEYRRQMGHQHLGFDPNVIARQMKKVGLKKTSIRLLSSTPDARGPELFALLGMKS